MVEASWLDQTAQTGGKTYSSVITEFEFGEAKLKLAEHTFFFPFS
jgi:hypothetical protein